MNDVKLPYVNCPKREKPLIARRIVEAVRNQTPPGRFLSKDSKGMWNDIGDGRAREKTSQALREGAPVIRVMVGKPTSSTNVAAAVKEAKRADRADKECGMTFPEKTAEEKVGRNPTPPTDRESKPAFISLGKSSDNTPPRVVVSNSGPMPLRSGSFGEQGISATLWQPLPRLAGRSFNSMTYPIMGGFSAPPQGRIDYSFGMPRHSDSVPLETVRGLLLGQLDPVQLAIQLLTPEEVAIVARRYAGSTIIAHSNALSSSRCTPTSVSSSITHPLTLNPQVSDSSSSAESSMHRTHSDGSSTDSPKQSSNYIKPALPKKKRKYIENDDA